MNKTLKCVIYGLAVAAVIPCIPARASSFADSVVEELQCQEGTVTLNAQVIKPENTIYTGTLSEKRFSPENIYGFYGASDKWKLQEEQENLFYYETTPEASYHRITGYLSEDGRGIEFDLDSTWADGTEKEQAFKNAKKLSPEELGKLLEIDIVDYRISQGEGYEYKVLLGCIDGTGTAFASPVMFKGTVEYADGYVVYVSFTGNYEISQKEEAVLLPMEQIMENAQMYAECGMINPLEKNVWVSQIELQYFLQEKNGTLFFNPAWNFRATLPASGDAQPAGETRDFFYLDAQDGSLLWYGGE